MREGQHARLRLLRVVDADDPEVPVVGAGLDAVRGRRIRRVDLLELRRGVGVAVEVGRGDGDELLVTAIDLNVDGHRYDPTRGR